MYPEFSTPLKRGNVAGRGGGGGGSKGGVANPPVVFAGGWDSSVNERSEWRALVHHGPGICPCTQGHSPMMFVNGGPGLSKHMNGVTAPSRGRPDQPYITTRVALCVTAGEGVR